MQISNNISQQNFGMAFKIKGDGGAEWIKKQPQKVLDQLAKAGEELKDTEFYHLIAGKDGLVISKGKITDPQYTNCEFKSDALTRPHYSDSNLQDLNLSLEFSDGVKAFRDIAVPKESAAELAKNIFNSEGIERLVNLTKAFEAEAQYKNAQELAAAAAEKVRQNSANDLITKFKIDA